MPAIWIIYQFIGFLTQTFPIVILCFVPFHDEELPLPRKKLDIFFGSAVVFLSAGFAFMSNLIYDPTGAHNALIRTASNLYMSVCVIIFVIAFFATVRSFVQKKLIVLILLIHYAAALFTLNSIVYGLMPERLTNSDYVLLIYTLDCLPIIITLSAVTYPFIYLFLKKEMQLGFSYMENSTLRRGCVYMLISLLLFIICIFSISTFKFYFGFSDASLLLFLFAFIMTDCIIYFIFFSEVRLTIQIRQSEEQLRNFDNQYKAIRASIAEARRIRHDVRHHLNQISAMNHRGEQEALDAYLKSYEASFHEFEQLPLCDYPAFDNILQYYIASARSHDIVVNTELRALQGNLNFDVIDITVLLGNLMENAIEACCKLPPHIPRFIRIWAKQADAVFLIKIENSCESGGIDIKNFTDAAQFPSTKHYLGHGQGLRSIHLSAEKYGGSAEFKKSNGVFTARIVMNIP